MTPCLTNRIGPATALSSSLPPFPSLPLILCFCLSMSLCLSLFLSLTFSPSLPLSLWISVSSTHFCSIVGSDLDLSLLHGGVLNASVRMNSHTLWTTKWKTNKLISSNFLHNMNEHTVYVYVHVHVHTPTYVYSFVIVCCTCGIRLSWQPLPINLCGLRQWSTC